MDVEIKIIIPGRVAIKKNTQKFSFVYTDKFGRKINRPYPLLYYTKVYKDWALSAIKACVETKNKYSDIKFPICFPVNVAVKFYFNSLVKIDLVNMLEGVLDVLAGNAGVYKESFPSHIYQILEDDSVKNIFSLDGTRFYYTPAEEERTEITIKNYKPGDKNATDTNNSRNNI